MATRTTLLAVALAASSTAVRGQQQIVPTDTTVACTTADTATPHDTMSWADTIRTGTKMDQDPAAGSKTVHGSLEIGGIHGVVPFALAESGVWNAYARGALGIDVLGIPLGITFDLGTDLPLRGQRNKIRFAFDPVRAASLDRWKDAHLLHTNTTQLDSLEQRRALLERQLAGQQARADALRALAPPDVPQPAVAGDTLRTPVVQVPEAQLPDSISSLPTDRRLQQRIDSLDAAAAASREALAQVEGAMQEARTAYGRAHAMAEAGKDGAPLPVKFARGIKRLDLGTCTPRGSEYLINGTNLQGISFEYVHKDLFLAVDHGRSFDDSWQNTDPVATNVRQLQQSLFFSDVRDLNPRKLTDIRTGLGAVEGSHAHVGYLHGTRQASVPGDVNANSGAPVLVNHVVEVDLGYEVKKGHRLRVVHARSIVNAKSNTESGEVQPGAGDLFRAGGDGAGAVRAIWSSDLPRSGTRIDLEGRSISPWFQSFGVGFIRTGSKDLELRLDQSLGERWRLRAKGILEERSVPALVAQQAVHLRRGQIAVSYRPSRMLTLSGTWLPVYTRWEGGSANSSASNCYQLGADLRQRWQGTVLTAGSSTALFTWQGNDGRTQEVVNQGLTCTVTTRAGLSVGVSWTSFTSLGTDTVPNASNAGTLLAYRTPGGWQFDAAAQFPEGDPCTWSCGLHKAINERMTLGFRGERFARYTTYFNNPDPLLPATDQAWTLSLAYQW